MKKIVIIGNSAAGIAAAEAIREKDKESSVAMVTSEPFLAYERPKILNLLAGKLKERDLFYRSADFYKNNAIDLRLEHEVKEVNLNRKKVVFKDQDPLEFDQLVIATGQGVVLPSLKGIHKEGVVALSGLADVKGVIEQLPVAHTVVVVGSGAIAVEVARIIAEKKMDVKFFGNPTGPVEGVDVMSAETITELIGESEVRAVRLANNKVIGASLVIFTEPRQPRMDFLADSQIRVNQGIIVDQGMRTSMPFVFACGDVAEIEGREKSKNWSQAVEDGRIAGGNLCQT